MDGSFQTPEKATDFHNPVHYRKSSDKDHNTNFDAPSQPAGNLAAQRLLRSGAIQPKLAINQPGDVHEQEADRIAEEILRMPEAALQRTCAACKTGVSSCANCQEETSFAQRKANRGDHSQRVDSASDNLVAGLGSGRPLDAVTCGFFESRFGADLSDVRIHTDRGAADSAQSIDALAYTLGRDLVFAPGRYTPETTEGRRLIAHELAHVLQQNPGVIQRYVAAQGTSQANPCAGWEKDPESFSIHVARYFVATQVNPALATKPVSVTCETDHDCKVTFGDDLIIDVYWYKDSRRAGAGRWTDQGRQFCAYDYSCDPQGQMILSIVKCYGTPKP